MILNHCAHARIVDAGIWRSFADALPDVFVDPDAQSVGIAANALGRASCRHAGALEALGSWALAMASTGELDGRNMAMLVNGFSKVRENNAPLMEALETGLIDRIGELNEIDIATVANGYARLSLEAHRLFDALRTPMLDAVGRWNSRHIAMVVNACARVRRRDEELLGRAAEELLRHCGSGPVSEDVLPSIVHAYVTRLSLGPPALVRTVEFSLPRVVARLHKNDVVLTVPALVHLPELCAPPEFCGPVFDHCASILGQLTCNAVVGILGAAAHLRHGCARFWASALGHCSGRVAGGEWEPRYVAALALLVCGLRGAPCCPVGDDDVERLLQSIAQDLGAGSAAGGRALRYGPGPVADLARALPLAGGLAPA
ncbi:unnamed protein product, partial [Prorocentrum cordatum]